MVIGVDEVGRGCWAGPLVAGAVSLNAALPGLRDSKLLSRAQRETLAVAIKSQAISWSLGWVSVEEIDALGLTEAVRVAMHRALDTMPVDYTELIIDGNYNFFPEDHRARALIKADNLIPAVSAASIIAKVARDAYMRAMATDFPGYGFEKHVGYGTAYHQTRLRLQGISVLHRRSYKPIMALSKATP